MKHTIQELRERQQWTLDQKIDHALGVLDQFISHCGGKKKVYISVSGKDSCTLLYLAREIFGNDIKAVFCNTGNEYPDIVKHIRTLENCEIIKPKYKVVEIVEKYGFPLVSKDIAHNIYQLKHTKSDYLRHVRMFGSPKYNGKGVVGMVPKKWQFLAEKQFDCSEKCCYYLKKQPFEKYEKKNRHIRNIRYYRR